MKNNLLIFLSFILLVAVLCGSSVNATVYITLDQYYPNGYYPDPANYDNQATFQVRIVTTGYPSVYITNANLTVSGVTYTLTSSTPVYNYSTTVDASDIGIGTSTYTVEAINSIGETDTETGSVTVVDSAEPVITNQDADPNPADYGDTVTISATVTDNVELAEVTLSINGITEPFPMSLTGTDIYEADIETVNDLGASGTYYYTITASDSSGNEIATDGTDYFVIVPDTTPPVIDETSITEVDDPVEYGDTITISVDVTDDVDVDTVTITVDGTDIINEGMTEIAGTDEYYYIINPEVDGLDLDTYIYTITATDTSENTATTVEEHSFVVQDTTSPTIVDVDDSEDGVVEYGDPITIYATVTDNYDYVVTVTITVDETDIIDELMLPTDTEDEYSITIDTEELGDVDIYDYTITATDSEENTPATAEGEFEVEDNIAPVIEDFSVDYIVCYGTTIGVSATVTDNLEIDYVEIDIDGNPYTLSELSEGYYIDGGMIDSTDIGLGPFPYTGYAYDTSGNQDTYGPAYVDIVDCDAPEIDEDSVSFDTPIEYGETFTITATITDDLSIVDSVTLVVDGVTLSNENMELIDTDEYSITIDTTEFDYLEEYTFTITAEDNSENSGPDEYTDTFGIVDTTAPEIDEDSVTEEPADQVGYTEAITITATVTDNYAVETVAITDSTGVLDKEMEPTENENEYSVTIYPEADGLALNIYYYTITATDTQELSDEYDGTFEVIDNIYPEISDVSDNGPVQYSEDITITATVTDEFGITSVTIDINGVTLSDNEMTGTDDEYSIIIDTEELGAIGTYYYTITAVDANGNDYQTEDEYTFVVYDENPEIHSVDASPNPVEVSAEVTFSADVTDDVEVGTVSLYIDELEYVGEMEYDSILELYTLTLDSSVIGVGEYDYYVYATDTYPNGPNDDRMDSETPLEVIESENPVVSNLNAEPNPVRNDEILTFSATVTDNGELDYVTVVVFNTENENVVEQMTETDTNYYEVDIDPSSDETMLDIGELTYYIVAKDTAENYNNTESATVVVYDTTGPDIDNLEVEPEVANQGEAVIISAEVTDDDGVASVTLDIDGVTLSNNEMEETETEDEYSITIDTTDLEFGTYEFTITATDNYGNPTEEIGEFTIAATPPAIANVVAEPERLNQGETVIISAEVTDDDSIAEVKVTIDGEDYDMLNTEGNTYTYEFDTNDMELGVYDFTITATDNYDSTATSTGTFTITIVSPISAEIRSDKTSGNADLDVSFSSSVTGGAGQLTYVWNFGDGYGDANKNVRHVFGKDGTFTVTLTVKDQYGNEGTDTVTIIVAEEKVSKEPRNLVRVEGVSFKDDTIEAGDRLDAYVTIENTGESRLEDVSVTIAIPELGVWAKSKPDDVREDDTETEHLSLEIPYDTEPGIYDVRITISNDDMKRVKHRDIRIV